MPWKKPQTNFKPVHDGWLSLFSVGRQAPSGRDAFWCVNGAFIKGCPKETGFDTVGPNEQTPFKTMYEGSG